MLREVRFLCLGFGKIDLAICERTPSISFDMALELLFKFHKWNTFETAICSINY
jgi:hypothetical protein